MHVVCAHDWTSHGSSARAVTQALRLYSSPVTAATFKSVVHSLDGELDSLGDFARAPLLRNGVCNLFSPAVNDSL